MRSRRFDHIVTLGYNCELSARFFQCFGFVDATLFSWAGADLPDELAYAIEHYEDIFSGEVAAPTRTFPLFFCKNTKIRAHGRAKQQVWTAEQPPPQDFIDAERAELRTVAEYNPESHAADLKRGDTKGWRLIFDEFRPKTIKKQAHKFKFEDDGH